MDVNAGNANPPSIWVLVVNVLVGLRVSEEEETVGLDLSQHGESAYNN